MKHKQRKEALAVLLAAEVDFMSKMGWIPCICLGELRFRKDGFRGVYTHESALAMARSRAESCE